MGTSDDLAQRIDPITTGTSDRYTRSLLLRAVREVAVIRDDECEREFHGDCDCHFTGGGVCSRADSRAASSVDRSDASTESGVAGTSLGLPGLLSTGLFHLTLAQSFSGQTKV